MADAVRPLHGSEATDHDAHAAYEALTQVVAAYDDAYDAQLDLVDPDEVFALGYAVPGIGVPALAADTGLQSVSPLTLAWLDEHADEHLAHFVVHDLATPERTPLARRLAQHLARAAGPDRPSVPTVPPAAHPAVAELAHYEAALSEVPTQVTGALQTEGTGWCRVRGAVIASFGADLLSVAERVDAGSLVLDSSDATTVCDLVAPDAAVDLGPPMGLALSRSQEAPMQPDATAPSPHRW